MSDHGFSGRPGPEDRDDRTGTAPNGKPYESVWDYPRPPRLEQVDHLVEVRHRGVVVARSNRCLRVLETSQPPAYYLPPQDVTAELLRPSPSVTYCEWKGPAAYADIVVEGGAAGSGDRTGDSGGDEGIVTVADGAWTYPDPTGAFAAIRGHWAFYAQKLDQCMVDGEVVDPNDGSFYGGWITVNITGPFKGAPGTGHW